MAIAELAGARHFRLWDSSFRNSERAFEWGVVANIQFQQAFAKCFGALDSPVRTLPVMQIQIQPYLFEYADSVQRLNERLREAGVEEGFLLPECGDADRVSEPFETFTPDPISKRHFLLIDGGEVRGGFILQDQQFEIRGQQRCVTNIQMPITEGLIDRRYANLAPLMIRRILARNPLVFSVGMGAADKPFPRFLAASRWRVAPTEFLYYVLNPRHFLNEIRALQTSAFLRACTVTAAATGAGWVGIRLLHGVTALGHSGGARQTRLQPDRVAKWGAWADELWASYRRVCSFAAVRNSEALTAFHPPAPNLHVYTFRDGRGIAGWSAVQVTDMRDDRYFGNLRVAAILDSVCMEGFETAVMLSTLEVVRNHRADLAIANHTHAAWIKAMRRAGFLRGPSNFLLALSPKLSSELQPGDESAIHISRADGDGRIHL